MKCSKHTAESVHGHSGTRHATVCSSSTPKYKGAQELKKKETGASNFGLELSRATYVTIRHYSKYSNNDLRLPLANCVNSCLSYMPVLTSVVTSRQA